MEYWKQNKTKGTEQRTKNKKQCCLLLLLDREVGEVRRESA